MLQFAVLHWCVQDGGYIPRILFMNTAGRVDASIKNEHGNPKYGYFYHDPADVARSMEVAARKLGGNDGEL